MLHRFALFHISDSNCWLKYATGNQRLIRAELSAKLECMCAGMHLLSPSLDSQTKFSSQCVRASCVESLPPGPTHRIIDSSSFQGFGCYSKTALERDAQERDAALRTRNGRQKYKKGISKYIQDKARPGRRPLGILCLSWISWISWIFLGYIWIYF